MTMSWPFALAAGKENRIKRREKRYNDFLMFIL